jgi:pimeloyl-ACP methyl ester carboxylesterase
MALGRWMLDPVGGVQIEEHWVPVAGAQMHCLTAGAGPELILLHGILGTASTWEPTIPGLAEHSTIYAVDALGIGESERVPGINARLEAQADRVVEFMDHFAIRSADFLGTSHGGAVALALAAKHPGRVRNLALHAPANPYSRISDPMINFYLTGLGTWFAHHITNLPESMQSLALGRMYGDPSHLREGSLDKYMNSLRVSGTVDYVLDILRTWFDDMEKLRLALERVRGFPTLLLWGNRDRAVALDSARELKGCFDRVELEVLPGVGHVPFEECPETLTPVVNSFLNRMRGAGPQLVQNQARLA